MTVINEEFLAFLWKYYKLGTKLYSSNNDLVEIIYSGEKNLDSGPDFCNAKIKINGTIWVGNIEIHVNESDWYKHKHNNNESYKKIILHLVYNADVSKKSNKDLNITTIELKNLISETSIKNYFNLLDSESNIPCHSLLSEVNSINFNSWLSRVGVARLENKTKIIENLLENNITCIETTFYNWLAYCFGFKINNLPFIMLAKSLPLNILLRHIENELQLEALLFGQAGFLNKEYQDDYPRKLKNEYKFLAHKYSLIPLDESIWKFMRTRPDNFPTIRISQFANLLKNLKLLLQLINTSPEYNEIVKLLDTKVSIYWLEHSCFDKKSNKSRTSRKLGSETINNLIVNAIVPFIFLLGNYKCNNYLKDKAIQILENIKPESNRITKIWKTYNILPENALESQALIELYNSYCQKKQCLNCSIGASVILDIN